MTRAAVWPMLTIILTVGSVLQLEVKVTARVAVTLAVALEATVAVQREKAEAWSP